MSARAVYNAIMNSKLYFLVYDNKILGARAVVFNVSTRVYDYFDFSLDGIKDAGIKKFMNTNKGNIGTKLLIKHLGLLVTKEEIENNIVISECKAEIDIIRILKPFIEIYK